MLAHEEFRQSAPLSWAQVTGFLLTVGQQIELQDDEGNSFVVLTRERYDLLQGRNRAGFPTTPSASLTERERQCLQLVSRGMTTGDAARELGVAQNTVAQHLASVRRRYGVRSTMAAAAAARSQGLVD